MFGFWMSLKRAIYSLYSLNSEITDIFVIKNIFVYIENFKVVKFQKLKRFYSSTKHFEAKFEHNEFK